jgi:guanosine-3',5'-bis(diphosphate) 3'-pyrophosphohydrolase
MSQSLEAVCRPLLEAVSFAARAHKSQIRKDGQTPYAAHVFRVGLILSWLFGVKDQKVLAAAILHDTVEDTTTDFDDIEERWGNDVAGWVGLLSKDKRLAYEERETAYCDTLARAPWQVQVCKLADLMDNILDMTYLPPGKRLGDLPKKRRYLEALKSRLKPEAAEAWEMVARLLDETEARVSGEAEGK